MRSALKVNYMELDEYIPGNLLFVDSDSIKTTDGTTTSIIVGNVLHQSYKEGVGSDALFNKIFSFVQLTIDTLIIVDSGNNCTRVVNRTTNSTEPYVGKCGKSGYVDGYDARFSAPISMIRYRNDPNFLIVTDHKNNALRVVDSRTKITSTLVRSDMIRDTRYAIQDGYSNTFYITTNSGVYLYSLGDDKPSLLAGSPYPFPLGSYDGTFDQTMFRKPNHMLLLNKDTLLVADDDNHKIRVLDLVRNITSSICTGIPGLSGGKDGNASVCTLNYPHSFLLVNDTLLIGEIYKIRKIAGM